MRLPTPSKPVTLGRAAVHMFGFAMLASCASLRSAQTPPDVTGTYSYTSTAHGQPVNGTIVVTRSDSTYTVVMSTGGMTRDILFRDVTVSGNRVTATAQTPAGATVALHLTIDGQSLKGDWSLGEQGAPLTGKRASSSP